MHHGEDNTIQVVSAGVAATTADTAPSCSDSNNHMPTSESLVWFLGSIAAVTNRENDATITGTGGLLRHNKDHDHPFPVCDHLVRRRTSIRPDAPRMIRGLRDAGIQRVVLVTGDRADIADTVGRIVGVDPVLADCDPADKLAAVQSESAQAATIMVGDGVNDAPALATAGVGVALASRGATASSETADVVLTVDRVDALADAILIAQRSKRIALQAVVLGMGLSLMAMIAAAAGLLPPAAGAVLQELIDVLAIAVALTGGSSRPTTHPGDDPARHRYRPQLRVQHDATLAVVEQIRAAADGLSTRDCDLAPTRALLARLETELLPMTEPTRNSLSLSWPAPSMEPPPRRPSPEPTPRSNTRSDGCGDSSATSTKTPFSPRTSSNSAGCCTAYTPSCGSTTRKKTKPRSA